LITGWVRDDRIKGDRKYYFGYRGSIPLKDIFAREFPDSYLHIYKFAVKIDKNKYYLIEPPNPDDYDFHDPLDLITYIYKFKRETRVYKFEDKEELKAALLSRGIPPPPLP
jgi:hypothetical protein